MTMTPCHVACLQHSWHSQQEKGDMQDTKTRAHSASLRYLLLAAELLTLMLVTCLEGVPVTLTAPAPGVVAQGT